MQHSGLVLECCKCSITW